MERQCKYCAAVTVYRADPSDCRVVRVIQALPFIEGAVRVLNAQWATTRVV